MKFGSNFRRRRPQNQMDSQFGGLSGHPGNQTIAPSEIILIRHLGPRQECSNFHTGSLVVPSQRQLLRQMC